VAGGGGGRRKGCSAAAVGVENGMGRERKKKRGQFSRDAKASLEPLVSVVPAVLFAFFHFLIFEDSKQNMLDLGVVKWSLLSCDCTPETRRLY
jgi:hypothetical protein